MKSLFVKGALLFGLIASSIPAAQAVSYDGWWYAYRNNSAGTSYIVMRPHANHFCYLAEVTMTDIDTGGEKASCEVKRSGSVWVLEARMGASSDADIRCEAVCYNN